MRDVATDADENIICVEYLDECPITDLAITRDIDTYNKIRDARTHKLVF